MSARVYAIEGIDRLGKSTLIQNIQKKLGYFQSIHFSKPPKWLAEGYMQNSNSEVIEQLKCMPYFNNVLAYQADCFNNSMKLARLNQGNLIFDRWHLGEYVYAPMYRNYPGNYVFDLERENGLNAEDHIRLILLVEDFTISTHFVDDGDSLGGEEKREAEQNLFIEAFHQSLIQDKRIICVTDADTGKFLPEDKILQLALA